MRFYLFIIVFLANQFAVLSQVKPDNLFFKDKINSQNISQDYIFYSTDYYHWGASIIKGDNGKYHLFYSRWKKEYSFFGWLTKSEIARATSDYPYGPWEYQETILQGSGGDSWDAITAHNPKITHFEGKYYLYYISTNFGEKVFSEETLKEVSDVGYSHPLWNTLRTNQRTGLVFASSLEGPWTRLDKPIIEPSGPITTLTVNPAIAKDDQNTYHLIVKGDKPGSKKFERNQAVAISESPIGPFVMQEKAVIDDLDTEDMSIWYDSSRNRFYGVFHAHQFVGMITSLDGLNWQKAAEYILLGKDLIMKGGKELIPDRMERPFIYVENGKPIVLCLAIKKEDESFTIFLPIKWGDGHDPK
jgi:alpha-L-fucosidase